MKQTQAKKHKRSTGACITWMAVGFLLVLVCFGYLILKRQGLLYSPSQDVTAAVTNSTETAPRIAQPETAVITPTNKKLYINPTTTASTPAPKIPAPTPSPTAAPTVEPSAVPTIHPENGDVLRLGMSEPIVLDVQIRLMVLEYLDFDQPDNEYSLGTREAIIRFQKLNSLPITGKCDAATFRLLNSDDAIKCVTVEGDSGEEVSFINDRLIELGYLETEFSASAEHNFFDEKTSDAVIRFRQKNGLEPIAVVDSQTFELLMGEDGIANFFSIGESGDKIKQYQQRLYDLGYLVGTPDGVYGNMTREAVKRFQQEHGLIADGSLGISTLEQLNSNAAKSFVFSEGMSGNDVKKLQQRLIQLGYISSGSNSGNYGEVTAKGVGHFQRLNGLKQTGQVDAATMAKLLSDKAKAPMIIDESGSVDTATQGVTITYGKGVETFIDIAMSKKGCKYVRGAKGPTTFDCSGFVYWCLNQAGVEQSYMTSIGWRTCKKYKRITSMKDLKRGDVLVFVGSSSDVGHVGIYLGNDKMIDAGSGKGCVVIRDSIQTGYWRSHFLMAYRIWD